MLERHHVAELVAELAKAGLRKQTIRKTVSVLAMILDHDGIQPNPARDPRIKLPREEKRELTPPSAEHVLAVYALLPIAYRLPCSCSTRPGCASASSRLSPGAMSTSGAGVGASGHPLPRRARRDG
jgi:hypothetical protein